MIRTLLAASLFLTPATIWAETIQSDEASSLSGVAETVSTGVDTAARMTVPVKINGQGPFHFIIDTGSERTVISRELADKLALTDGKRARLISMGGVKDVRIVNIDTLTVSSNVMRGIKAPALPGRYIGADGLLGIDSLKNQRVVLDFMQQTMMLEPSNSRSVREERDPAGTIVVSGKTKLGQLVLVDADANGEDISVIVDTGGQNSVGNMPFRRLMARGSDVSTLRQVELLSVVGDKIPADYALVGKMRIGGVSMGNAAIAFVDAHPFKQFGLRRKPAMLLGMESLRAFRRVSIDFANRKVKFLMPEAAKGL